MSKIFDSVIIYGSGTTNSSTLETLNGNKINTFTIKDNGNVGIGTSTPTSKLHVDLGSTSGSDIAIQTNGAIPFVTGNRTTFSVNNNGRLTAGDVGTPSSTLGHTLAAPHGSYNAFNVQSGGLYQGLFFVNTDGSFSLGNPVIGGGYFDSNGTNTFRFYGANSGQSQKIGINGGIPTASLHVVGSDSSSSNFGLKVQNSGGTDNLVVRNDATIIIGNPNEYGGSSIYFDRPNRKIYINGNANNGLNGNDIDICSKFTRWGINSGGSGFGVTTEFSSLDVFDSFSSFKLNKHIYNSYEPYTSLGVTWKEGTGALPNSSIGSFIYNRNINLDDIYNRTLNGIKIDTSLGSWTNTTGTSTTIGLNVTVGNADVNYAAVFNGGNVGIGTSTPSEKLDVNGKTKTTNLQVTSSPSPGYVLTSDGSGNATWQEPQDLTKLGTGLTIHFSGKTIFNLPSSPVSGNISGDTTNAKFGMIQKIYHQSSVEPTFPTTWKLVGEGVYFTNELNIIYAEYVEPTWIEYWIIQQQ